jgi:predicted dehydrogenase
MRYEPIFVKARELLREIGELRTVSSVKIQPYTSRGEHDWVPRTGAMRELSVHDFDLIHWIAGIQPVAVRHSVLEHRWGWEKDSSFMLTVEYSGANGPVLGQLQGMYSPDASFCYRDLTLTFVGSKGYMRVERPDRIALHLDTFTVHEVDPGGVNAFAEELGHFCRVLRGEETNAMGPEYGVMTAKIIDGAEEIAGR